MLTRIELGKYLQGIRLKNELSLRRVNELTEISYSHLNMIEHGKRNVTPALLKNLANLYKIDYLDLYEKAGYLDLINDEKEQFKKNYVRIPVLGSIPAGTPVELVEDIVDYEDISEDMLKGGKEYFALKIKGDSMSPKFLDNDTIIVLKQNSCETGQDSVVMVNGDDGTFKRVFLSEQGITLQPLKNGHMPSFYSNEYIVALPVKILGVAKEIRRCV